MAITVNGQILRNLPEQVSKNTEDIIELQDTTNLQGDKIAALENSIITDITLNNLEVTGNTVIGNANTDTLAVTGVSSFNGNVSVTGNVTASGSLAAASASFASETISGNLTVNGNIVNALLNNTENVLSGAAEVSDYYANEGNLAITPLSNEISGIYFTFAHWRVSNGKLSIVVSGYTNNLKTRASNGLITYATDANNRFDLPTWIFDKLIPNIEITDPSIIGMLASQEKKTIHSTNDVQTESWSEGVNLRAAVYKLKYNSVGIAFAAEGAQQVTDGLNYEFRYEFNFML